MPRRKQRFSKLIRQLRENGGVPSGTGPTVEFHKYLTGQKTITVPNAIDGAARKLYRIALIPFAVSATGTTANERYLASISAYSWNGLLSRASNFDPADFGIYIDSTGAKNNNEYYPALVKASYTKSGATTITDKTSQITGNKYNYTPRRTFGFPFGRTTAAIDTEEGTAEASIANVDESDVATSLQKWLADGKKGGTPETDAGKRALSVSFDPEIFRPVNSQPAAPATAISGVTVS